MKESLHPVVQTNGRFFYGLPFVQEGDYRHPMVAILQSIMVAACMQVNFQLQSQHLSACKTRITTMWLIYLQACEALQPHLSKAS